MSALLAASIVALGSNYAGWLAGLLAIVAGWSCIIVVWSLARLGPTGAVLYALGRPISATLCAELSRLTWCRRRPVCLAGGWLQAPAGKYSHARL